MANYNNCPLWACKDEFYNEISRIKKLLSEITDISHYMPKDIKESNLYLANEISKHIENISELEKAMIKQYENEEF